MFAEVIDPDFLFLRRIGEFKFEGLLLKQRGESGISFGVVGAETSFGVPGIEGKWNSSLSGLLVKSYLKIENAYQAFDHPNCQSANEKNSLRTDSDTAFDVVEKPQWGSADWRKLTCVCSLETTGEGVKVCLD